METTSRRPNRDTIYQRCVKAVRWIYLAVAAAKGLKALIASLMDLLQ